MNNMQSLLNQSYLPDVCSSCAGKPGVVQKPVPAHKYGDYVVLTPDMESSKKLYQLAMKAGQLVSQEINSGDVELFAPERMHLTLAMPLKPLSKGEAGGLLQRIQSGGADSPIQFDLIFKGPNDGGSQGFSFGTATFASGFDVRLREPLQPSLYGHNSSPAHRNICSLADNIQRYCESQGLVSLERNPDGKCNKFNPHITLGDVGSQPDRIALHNRVAHYDGNTKKALAHLMSVKAAEIFKCAEHGDKCPRLPLRFDKVEILRVDSLKDHSNQSHRLASLDLSTGKSQISEYFPTCSHIQEGPAYEDMSNGISSSPGTGDVLSAASSYEPELFPAFGSSAVDALAPAVSSLAIHDPVPPMSISGMDEINAALGYYRHFDQNISYRLGADHTGTPMIQVRFQNKAIAENFLNNVAPEQKTRKLNVIDGYYVVNLGPERLKNMFGGVRGPEIYTRAITELGGVPVQANPAAHVASKHVMDKKGKTSKITSKADKKTSKKDKDKKSSKKDKDKKTSKKDKKDVKKDKKGKTRAK